MQLNFLCDLCFLVSWLTNETGFHIFKELFSIKNGHQVQVLWDTGTEVSIMTNNYIDITELLDSPLEVNAANGTSIPYTGWAELEFNLPLAGGRETKILVPFRIILEELIYPIVRYVIREIVNCDCVPLCQENDA